VIFLYIFLSTNDDSHLNDWSLLHAGT